MPLDVALGTSSARVRTSRISKDLARALPQRQAFGVVAPLAPPRLWTMVTGAVLGAFETAIVEGAMSVGTLQRALGAGAQALARVQAALVEPNLSLDAQMVCMAAAGDVTHMAVSSGMRVYRARNGEPQRLLGKAQRSPGISHGGLLVATERLVLGDLYVFGSRDAFGMRSIGAIAGLLAQRPDAPVADLCDAVLAPCRAAGLGAALVVLRVL
ncbi:MAG: hypothetical protein HY909_00170 [Deltaproteobacteria bacterium]|nr:hypothetical protein [Deltaproteobacteria bacterium]